MSVFAARQDADQLKRYGDAGVDRAVILLRTGARDAVLKTLDASAALVRMMRASRRRVKGRSTPWPPALVAGGLHDGDTLCAGCRQLIEPGHCKLDSLD
jgi:hypothetical protein